MCDIVIMASYAPCLLGYAHPKVAHVWLWNIKVLPTCFGLAGVQRKAQQWERPKSTRDTGKNADAQRRLVFEPEVWSWM